MSNHRAVAAAAGLLGLLAVAAGLYFGTARAGHGDVYVVVYPTANQANFGITFRPTPVPSGKAPMLPGGAHGITADAALASAEQHAAAVDSAHHLLPGIQVGTQYGILSDSHIARMTPVGEVPIYRNVPAWLVTFTGDGVTFGSTRPINGQAGVHHEETLVVDAATGKFLFSYS